LFHRSATCRKPEAGYLQEVFDHSGPVPRKTARIYRIRPQKTVHYRTSDSGQGHFPGAS
jgi:hypothetical protein